MLEDFFRLVDLTRNDPPSIFHEAIDKLHILLNTTELNKLLIFPGNNTFSVPINMI